MKLAYWQIIVSGGGGILAVVVAPFIAAQLAVRRLSRELDNARLDELRGVLDEGAVELAHADRVIVVASNGLTNNKKLDLGDLRTVADRLVVLYWRLALRLSDDTVANQFNVALAGCEDVHTALHGWGPGDDLASVRDDLRRARRKFTEGHLLFLNEATALVGPSKAALVRSRRASGRSRSRLKAIWHDRRWPKGRG
jgi:hypothetical protein